MDTELQSVNGEIRHGIPAARWSPPSSIPSIAHMVDRSPGNLPDSRTPHRMVKAVLPGTRTGAAAGESSQGITPTITGRTGDVPTATNQGMTVTIVAITNLSHVIHVGRMATNRSSVNS